jgi:hypothetical protein
MNSKREFGIEMPARTTKPRHTIRVAVVTTLCMHDAPMVRFALGLGLDPA